MFQHLDCRLVLLLSVLFVTACEKSPTGRWQLALIPEELIEHFGVQTFTHLKQAQPIESDPKINTVVHCVTKAIIDVLPKQKRSWEVVIFRDPNPNAFALPGGKIGINAGILRITENQAQLATIIGHEVAHILADHANERMTQEFGVEVLLMLVGLFGSDEGEWEQEMVQKGLGLGAKYGVLLPFSRAHEREADIVGLQLMAQAGFDPRESLDFWKNMSQVNGNQAPELLSTHPSHGSRFEILQDEMAHALEIQKLARNDGKQPSCSLK